ncbi:CHAT domain-containing protein [Devosia sp.]|uniref:CHAT domain-containing protein n=1 Tax=Devosia sp. TaxID=1871048 RepID=UPI002631781D|nr:CHAT domain-containing protein [Devosia sp.]
MFLAANPSEETRLRLGREATEIKDAIRGKHGLAKIGFEQDHAIRLNSIIRIVHGEMPTIVHFSGHGSSEGQLIFEDENGNAAPARAEPIANLFKFAGGSTRLVVLNACYSALQAEAIIEHVDAVIGMNDAIGDAPAIAFARTLYELLAQGANLRQAFELARVSIDIQNLPDANKPQLLERIKGSASSTYLLSNEERPPPR